MEEPKEEDDYDVEEDVKEPPKLKYFRMTNDISEILKKHPTSCLALHPKFICIGTVWGSIHLVDHQGYRVRNARPLRAHTVAVNCLDIDERGDFVASCSDDGFVRVSGFYKEDSDYDLPTGRLVKAVAIDPQYGKSGKRFITGDERLILHEKTFLSWKSTVLSEAEGSVQNISWRGQFVAWASDLGVRVFDLNNRCSLGFMKWPLTPDSLPQNYRCNLAWSGNILLIGWVDMVRVCIIRKRGPGDVTGPQLPEFMVEPQCTFKTEFYLSGVAPLGTGDLKALQLVLLGYGKGPDEEGNARRPTLQVVQPTSNDYIEIASPDELMLKEYKKCQVNQYHLEHVAEENRYFVVSPRDIVVASVFDANDQVEWLMKHQMYEEALEAVNQADKYSLQQVGGVYIDFLFAEKDYTKAGEMCAKILGKDKKLWEEKVYTLARIQQLKSISAYLPVDDYQLDKQVYEMVLYEYLKTDPQGFLDLIKKWPPTLYQVPAIVNLVIEHVIVARPDNAVLLEALAILYGHDGKYDLALAMYLKLKHRGIFSMIRKHNLYAAVVDMVVDLMQLDPTQAVALFLEKPDKKDKTKPKEPYFPVETIVKKLQNQKSLLYQYLDALDTSDTNQARPHHPQLVQLYADFGRERLLRFLRRSDHYPIQEALKICQDRCLYPEMVYLLQCMGRSKQALTIMTDQLKDIGQAIEFCKEQDDQELWQNLVEKSLDKPEFISYLLNNIGTAVDPAMLVKRIAPGCVIPGLKSSLAKMMKDYGLQVSVQEGCKRILAADNLNLQARLLSMQTRGYRVDGEHLCGACNEAIIHHAAATTSVVVFFCRHAFHGDCLKVTDSCPVCHAK